MLVKVRITPRGALAPVTHLVSLASAAALLGHLRTAPVDANGALSVSVEDEAGPHSYSIDAREAQGLCWEVREQFGPMLGAALTARLDRLRDETAENAKQIEELSALLGTTNRFAFGFQRPTAHARRAKPAKKRAKGAKK